MGISFVTGPLGAGKSHYVVGEIMVPAVRAGRRVFHNLPLVDKAWRRILPQGRSDLLVKMDDEFLKNIQVYLGESEKQHYGALIIIDEAHEYWPHVGCTPNKELWRWFSWSRHQGFDIVLVTQAISRVSRNFSGLYDREWKFFNQGLRGLGSRSYSLDSYVRGDRKRQTRTIWRYSDETFKLYESQNSGVQLHDPVGQKIRTPMMVAGLFLGSLLLVFYLIPKILHRGTAVASNVKQEVSKEKEESGQAVRHSDKPEKSENQVGSAPPVLGGGDITGEKQIKALPVLFYDGVADDSASGTVVGYFSVGDKNYIMIRSSGKVRRYSYIGRSSLKIGSCYGECDDVKGVAVGSSFAPVSPSVRSREKDVGVEVASRG